MEQQELNDISSWVEDAFSAKETYQEARDYLLQKHPRASTWRDKYQSEVRGAGIVKSHGKLSPEGQAWLKVQVSLAGRFGGKHTGNQSDNKCAHPNGRNSDKSYVERYQIAAMSNDNEMPPDNVLEIMVGCSRGVFDYARKKMIEAGWKADRMSNKSWRFVPPPEPPKEITLTEAQLSEIVAQAIKSALSGKNGK